MDKHEFFKLADIAAPAGYESPVADHLRENYSHLFTETKTDRLGISSAFPVAAVKTLPF